MEITYFHKLFSKQIETKQTEIRRKLIKSELYRKSVDYNPRFIVGATQHKGRSKVPPNMPK